MKVLIAEDDELIRKGLKDILETEGYTTFEAADGEEAIAIWKDEAPDFICLDIMMPKMSGYDVCKAIRNKDSSVPIIFISAKSEEIDKVVGLELGADDFIVKPFGVREVVARIRAVTRRCIAKNKPNKLPAHFTLGDLEIFPEELRARRGDSSIELSLREVRILELFASSKGLVLSRDAIFDKCWDGDFFPLSRTLDQHIAKLRKRIENDPKDPQIIKTVHGVGYRWDG
ncbi:MAG: response regulator transcription factor [Proteobacteria bacterium]|nr:response regulator transcription factor [Pseudomonadota bacterium]